MSLARCRPVTPSINGTVGNMDGRRYPNSGWLRSRGQGRLSLVLCAAGGQSMRTKHAIAVCITGLAMSGWASSAWAHHAFAAEFDANKPVNFKGRITKMEWVNPHPWLHVDVKNTDGTVVNWAIEAGTPNVLFRRGFTKDSLLPGTEIAIDGYQGQDGSHRATGGNLTRPT